METDYDRHDKADSSVEYGGVASKMALPSGASFYVSAAACPH
ncbi:hypothetical protein ACK37A_02785 [Aeromonas veronii]